MQLRVAQYVIIENYFESKNLCGYVYYILTLSENPGKIQNAGPKNVIYFCLN